MSRKRVDLLTTKATQPSMRIMTEMLGADGRLSVPLRSPISFRATRFDVEFSISAPAEPDGFEPTLSFKGDVYEGSLTIAFSMGGRSEAIQFMFTGDALRLFDQRGIRLSPAEANILASETAE